MGGETKFAWPPFLLPTLGEHHQRLEKQLFKHKTHILIPHTKTIRFLVIRYIKLYYLLSALIPIF